MIVRVKSPPNRFSSVGRDGDLIYRIEEKGDHLIWKFIDELGECQDAAFVLPRAWYMENRKILAEEAEIITGLDHPMAAMDRLREMLYESQNR